MPSRRTIGNVAGWMSATAASAAIALAALQPVLNTAVPDRFTLPTVAELRADNAAPAPDIVPEAIISSPTATASPETVAVVTEDPPSDDSPAGSDAESGGEAGDRDAGPATESTTVDGWTQVDHSDGSTSYVQAFDTDGGSTTIEVEPGQATLISATPIDPYAVDVHHEDPERIVVKFFVSNHMFVVEAMWWEGRPYANVSEVS